EGGLLPRRRRHSPRRPFRGGHDRGVGRHRETTIRARHALVGPLDPPTKSVREPGRLVELARDGEVANDALELLADPALEGLGVDSALALGAQRAVAQATLEGPLDDFTVHNEVTLTTLLRLCRGGDRWARNFDPEAARFLALEREFPAAAAANFAR